MQAKDMGLHMGTDEDSPLDTTTDTFQDNEVTDWYCAAAKWDRLNASQRQKVREMRTDKEKLSAAAVETNSDK